MKKVKLKKEMKRVRRLRLISTLLSQAVRSGAGLTGVRDF